MSNIKLKSLLCESIPDNEEVAIFKLYYGKKNFVTKMILQTKFFSEYDSAVKAFGHETLKFTKPGALRYIEANKQQGDMFGIVDVNGNQEIIK